MGTYSQDGQSLTLASGPMTLKACQGPVAAQEAAIVAALPLVASFTLETTLALQDADGNTLLTYAPGMSSLAGTSWQATGMRRATEQMTTMTRAARFADLAGVHGPCFSAMDATAGFTQPVSASPKSPSW